MQVRVKIGGFGISLIAVSAAYAPPEVDESENSDNFYGTLQSTIESICEKDVIIVAGDFNARVGQSTSRSSLHGKHNPHVRNNNGRKLVDFCNYNNLAITNTLFPHKKIHQYTWHHPGQKNGGHVFDYILINAQYRSCILDTKVFKKTLHISDHFPVIAKFFKSLCHKQHFRNNSHKQYIENSRELDENIINNFRNQLAVPSRPKNTDELWKVFKESLTSAKKVLPSKHTKYKKDWVTKEIRQLTIEKTDVYRKIMQHKQKNQSVALFLKSQYVIIKKKCIKACKLALNSWWKQKSKEAEDDYEMSLKQGKGGSLIKNLKSLTKSRSYSCLKIIAKDGTTRLTTTKSKLKR